ncbi:MAG: YfiR family protein [Steroidobacteraceae bacterium]
MIRANGNRSRELLWSVVALCGLWGPAWSQRIAAEDLHSEDSVKAAFVLRFAGYIEWPEDAVQGETFTIAVLGSGNVATQLQTLGSGRALLNRPVQIRRITSIQDVGDARIVYVGTDRRGDLRKVLAALAGRSVLVISSEDAALAAGSTINLLVADQRVRFEVSLAAARQARLRISSELLSLAVRVQK